MRTSFSLNLFNTATFSRVAKETLLGSPIGEPRRVAHADSTACASWSEVKIVPRVVLSQVMIPGFTLFKVRPNSNASLTTDKSCKISWQEPPMVTSSRWRRHA